MKRNMNFKSNRQSKKYTLADFNKARQYNVSLEDAYEIVAGYREINAKSPEARDLIYKRALKMVRDDDAEFAKELVANGKKKATKDKKIKEIISLKDAYDIVGGFKSVDKRTFDKAIELLKNQDDEFAKILLQMHKSGTSFSAMSIDEINAFDSKIERNAEVAYSTLTNESIEQIENKVLEDEEVKIALSNTPILDDEGHELADEEKDLARRSIIRTATIDSIPDIIENTEENGNSQDKIVDKVKNKTLGLLGMMRLEALRPKTSEYIKAIKEGSSSFFSKAATKMRNAFNFKKKVSISGQAILNKLSKAKERVTEYSKKVANAISSPKAKALMNKINVAAMTVVIAASSLCSGCFDRGGQKKAEPAAKVEYVDTTKVVKNDTITVVEATPKATAKEIVVPTEYSDSLGLMKESQWKLLQTSFNDGRPTFEKYYKMITDDMRGDLTRTQYLFAYQRMGFWNLPKHQEVLKQLDKYFECGEQLTIDVLPALKEVMPDGSIKDVKGTLNRYATNRTIECGEDPVLNIKEVKISKKKQVKPTYEQDGFIEEGSTTVISAEPEGFEETGSLTVRTVETDSIVRVNPSVDVYKANDLNDANAEHIGSVSIGDATSISVENKNGILVEGTNSNTTSVSSLEASDGFVEEGSTTIISSEGFEETGSTTYVSTIPSTVTITQDGFEETGTTVYVDKLPESITIAQEGFEETGSTTYVSTISSSITTTKDVSLTEDGEVQIVADSDEIESGTPAAGDVPERGGYLNKGLTQRQYEGSKTRIRNRYGENAYEEFSERITPEMRAKDGIFEGLSVAQAMYTTEKMILWSNDKHGEFAEEIKIITDYLKGCTDAISLEDAASVKAIIDRVNTDGTIDGVVGKNNVMAKYYQVGDCGETGSYEIVKIKGKVRETHPDAPDFPRFFMIRNTASEGFVEEGSTTVVTRVVYKDNVIEPTVQEYKGNHLNDANAEYIGDVTIEEATSINVEDKDGILVSEKPSSKPSKQTKNKKVERTSERPDARADYFRVRDQHNNR